MTIVPASPVSLTANSSPGASRIIQSSLAFPWRGFVVEHLVCSPGERPESESTKNVVSMVFGRPSRVDVLDGGRLISHLKPRGTITIKPAGLTPYARLRTHAESIHCVLQEDFTLRVLEELEYRPAASPEHHIRANDLATRRVMILLAEELQTGGQSGRLYAESLANVVAIRFLQADHGTGVLRGLRVSALPPGVLRRVQERMRSQLHLDLSLAAIATEAGYSRTHFLRMFQASSGMTPHQYLTKLRIDHAKKLLARKGSNLIDVASACGFSSQSHMTTIFRRHLGTTPAEFRRSLL